MTREIELSGVYVTCTICSGQFYKSLTSKRRTCSDGCRDTLKTQRAERSKLTVSCVICGTTIDRELRLRSKFCKNECAALSRFRRHNTHVYSASGYTGITGPDAREHPTALRNSWVLRHRKLAYDKYGEGPHFCYWNCGRMLNWNVGDATMKGKIVVDHADDDSTNDDASNLVISCSYCNSNRHTSKEERVKRGRTLNNRNYTCKNCNRTFTTLGQRRGHGAWCKGR